MIAMLTTLTVLALLLLLPLAVAGFVFWVWMLIHAIRNDNLDGSSRVLWVLLVWFLPLIGSVIYFFGPPGDTSRRRSWRLN